MNSIRIIAGMAATALVSIAAPLKGEAGSFTKTTTAGVPVRLGSHANWDKSCQGIPSRVEIVESPQHGRLSARVEPTTITRVDHGTRACVGHQTLATAVYYTPQPGFIGVDRFYYTSIRRNGDPLPQSGTVVVR